MDEQEALSFLGEQATPTPQQPTSLTGMPAPRVAFPEGFNPQPPQQLPKPTAQPPVAASGFDAAIGGPMGAIDQMGKDREMEYISKNTQDGVPFDPSEGLSGWERFALSFRRERENQVAYLQKKYGEQNVRLSNDDELIVRALDPKTQKARDILVDEKGMSARDLIDLMGEVPEIAASIIAVRKGQGKFGGLGKIASTIRDAVTGAAGAGAAGTAKDVGASLYDTGEADVGKILKDRSKIAALDVGMGAATYPIGRFFNWIKSPLHASRGEVQFDAMGAQKYFKDKYGKDYQFTIGESTGNPLFGRTETFMGKLSGSSIPFEEFAGKQEQVLRDLQNIIMGKTPLSDEEVGRQLIGELSKKVKPVETAVAGSAGRLATASQDAISDIVSGLTTPQRQLLINETGDAVRKGVTARRDAVVAEANRLYGVVNSIPGGTGKVFDGSNLQKSLQKIVDELPAPEVTKQIVSQIAGPSGAPLIRTTTGKEVLNDWVSPAIIGKIKQVTSLTDPKFSLQDLQQMRREVYDDMAASQAVTGLPNHRLNEIGKTLTQAIEDGVNSLQTGNLKTALQAANEHYKTKVLPFNRVGITDLFKRADEPGSVASEQIVKRVFSGDRPIHNYQILKETLGDTSPEFIKLKRSIADHLIEASRYPGDKLIDANSLKSSLAKFQTEHRAIADDIFGSKLPDMFKQLEFLGVAKGAQISADDLAKLVKDPSPTAIKLRGMVAAQKKQNELYSNEIIKSASAGQAPKVNPIEFVNRFVSNAEITPTDMSKVIGLLKGNQPLMDEVRAKTVEKIFRDASRVATAEDLSKLLSGDPTRIVSSTSVFKQIQSPTVRKKIETILGPEVYNDMIQYIHLQKASQLHEEAFEAAGGLARGAEISNLTHKGPIKYLYQSGKNWMVAKLLTTSWMRDWLSGIPKADQPGAFSLLLTSPQFIRAVSDEFGEGSGANAFMHSLKKSVDRYATEEGKKEQSAPEREKAAEQFLTK